jgi:hypothetical protein
VPNIPGGLGRRFGVYRKVRIRGAVKWYRVDEQPGDLLHFMAGVHLKDAESQAVATGLVTSAKKATLH